MIDAGPGTLRRLLEAEVKPEELTYIFLTHFHPDHVGDLVPLLFALKNTDAEERKHMLRVWGPRGFINFMHNQEMAYGRWLHANDEFMQLHEMKRQLLDFPGFRLIWEKVIHKHESVGLRFEVNGKKVAFSGDSGYCHELIRLCREADVAVLECSYPDELAVEGHLSPSLAAKIASEAGAKKLVFTHFYPGTDQSDLLEVAQKYYDGPIELAEDLKEIAL
ncbi:MAG: MBL fold metallo-hydrolase [Calditrichia bacterium]